MFYVVEWDGKKTVAKYELLMHAMVKAIDLGHLAISDDVFLDHPPIAYVANEDGECVFNPKFPKS